MRCGLCNDEGSTRYATQVLGGPAKGVYFVSHGDYSGQLQENLGNNVTNTNYPVDHTVSSKERQRHATDSLALLRGKPQKSVTCAAANYSMTSSAHRTLPRRQRGGRLRAGSQVRYERIGWCLDQFYFFAH